MYVLALRHGVDGYRLVLVGIGLGAMLTAVTSYLLTRIRLEEAQFAFVWLTGSLSGVASGRCACWRCSLLVLVPRRAVLGRYVRMLEHGDDVPRLLGIAVGRVRLVVLLLAVALRRGRDRRRRADRVRRARRAADRAPARALAVGRARAGGARRGGHDAAADLLARVVPSVELPVGLVTGIIGAPYLLWLLVRGHRSGAIG